MPSPRARPMSHRVSRWLFPDDYIHADTALPPSAYQSQNPARRSWPFEGLDYERINSKINRYIPISTRGPYGEATTTTTSWLPSFSDWGEKEGEQHYDDDDIVSETAFSDCSCCRNECDNNDIIDLSEEERFKGRNRAWEHSQDDCPECAGERELSTREYYEDYKRRFKEAVREGSRGRSRSRWLDRYGNNGYEQEQLYEDEEDNWGIMKPHILNSIKDRIGRDSGEDLRYDDPYLSYHDVCLRKEDVDCLRDDWLTDNNIAFWEEFLEHEILSIYSDNKIYLLRPSMVYMILQTPDPRTLITALPPMRKSGATHIFLPINDNKDPNVAEGGSHWSLLVIGVADGLAFHYDSLASSNTSEARRVTTKMEQILNRRLNFVDLVDTPQQENSTDCGVHVCMNMRYLLVKRLLSATAKDVVDMSLAGQGRKLDASSGRKEMYRIVSGLRRLAERSASPGDRKTGSPPRIE